jgi:hypothetical protein
MNASVANRLRSLNEEREGIIAHLAPSDSDYCFGGAHRLWVKECAYKTAHDYIERDKMMKSAGVRGVAVLHCAIPMPPDWAGVRPEECETYGHSASAFKDWRHFENALRYYFAKRGYVCYAVSLNEHKEIVFLADLMANVARVGLPAKGLKEDYTGKPPTYPATTCDYEAFSAEVEAHFAKEKTA